MRWFKKLCDSKRLDRIERVVVSIKLQSDRIENLLGILQLTGAKIMSQNRELEMKLDDALVDIAEINTLADSFAAVVAMLRQQVADEMAKEKVTPELREKVEQVFANAEAGRVKVVTAMTANTPAADIPPANPIP